MRVNTYFNRGIGLLIVISNCVFAMAVEQHKSFLDAGTILKQWESSYSTIKSMRVSCVEKLLWYKEPAKKPEGFPEEMDVSKVIKYHFVELTEQSKRHHMRSSTAEDGFAKPENILEQAFNGKITQEYIGATKFGTIENGVTDRTEMIDNPLRRNMEMTIDYFKKYEPDGVIRFAWTLRNAIDANIISIRPNLESIAGHLCHVIEIHSVNDPNCKEIFWVAHEKNMCLMKSQDYFRDGAFIEMEVQKLTSAKDRDGKVIFYPEKATRYVKYEFGETKYELTVKEFIPNIAIDVNSFRFAFPPGTEVSDHVLGMTFKSDGKYFSRSLINKSVTELKDYGIDLPLSDFREKSLLICFFDIEQRPSRNFIPELNKRIQGLNEKGIKIIIIQASKIEQSKLNEWVKENGIALPVRMIQKNEDKARINWGIQALPWMILTDKEHIVIDEGFSLSEIEEKLKLNTNGKQ